MTHPGTSHPPTAPGHTLTAGPMGIVIAVAGYLLAIVCALTPALLLALVLPPEALTGSGPADRSYLAVPVQYVTMFILGLVLARLWLRRRYTPDALGLTFPRSGRAWLIGVLGGVAFVVIGQLAGRLLASLAEAGEQVSAQVGLGETLLRDVAIILSMTVFAPLGEELIYRGLIFRGLHDAFARGAAWARRGAYALPALISSVLFAVSHGGEGQSTQLVFLVIAGLIYAWIYWRTGSLTVAVFAHSITNAINVVILAAGGSGLTTPGLWALVAVSPALAVAAIWVARAALGGDRSR